MSAGDWGETRQERRERKLRAKREQMTKSGASLRQNLIDAALRLARKRGRRSGSPRTEKRPR